jgi:hypothetical protein
MQPTLKQWLARKPAGPKAKKGLARTGRVRPISKKRSREGKTYSLLRAAFLQAHPACQAWAKIITAHPEVTGPVACPQSQEIHHTRGRHSGNYLNTDTWLAVSRWGHRWIHSQPREARKLGLIA